MECPPPPCPSPALELVPVPAGWVAPGRTGPCVPTTFHKHTELSWLRPCVLRDAVNHTKTKSSAGERESPPPNGEVAGRHARGPSELVQSVELPRTPLHSGNRGPDRVGQRAPPPPEPPEPLCSRYTPPAPSGSSSPGVSGSSCRDRGRGSPSLPRPPSWPGCRPRASLWTTNSLRAEPSPALLAPPSLCVS